MLICTASKGRLLLKLMHWSCVPETAAFFCSDPVHFPVDLDPDTAPDSRSVTDPDGSGFFADPDLGLKVRIRIHFNKLL